MDVSYSVGVVLLNKIQGRYSGFVLLLPQPYTLLKMFKYIFDASGW